MPVANSSAPYPPHVNEIPFLPARDTLHRTTSIDASRNPSAECRFILLGEPRKVLHCDYLVSASDLTNDDNSEKSVESQSCAHHMNTSMDVLPQETCDAMDFAVSKGMNALVNSLPSTSFHTKPSWAPQ